MTGTEWKLRCWIAIMAFLIVCFGLGWQKAVLDSERSKRIELEAENKQLLGNLVWEQTYGDTTRCERWKLEYFWGDNDKFDSIVITHPAPDSLLAVPPKDSVLVYVGDSSFWIPAHEWNSREVDDIFRITIDSSGVTE